MHTGRPQLTAETFAARCAQAGVRPRSRYRGLKKPVKLECLTCHRRWTVSSAASVLQGCGCRWCNRGRETLSLAKVARRCRRVGLELLGGYTDHNHTIRVSCLTCRRVWSPCAQTVFNGYGCSQCRDRHGEAENRVRSVLEDLTGWRFPRTNPEWLKGRSGRTLELDGYNASHQVAFEYQGQHHYQPLHGSVELLAIKRRDERKRVACYRHGVTLIRVPYWQRDVKALVRARLAAC